MSTPHVNNEEYITMDIFFFFFFFFFYHLLQNGQHLDPPTGLGANGHQCFFFSICFFIVVIFFFFFFEPTNHGNSGFL